MSILIRLATGAVVAATAATSLAACGGSKAGDANETATVKIMVGGIDKVIYLPAKLTDQLGYFKDAGTNIQLLDEPSGADAENMLLAGQVEAVVGFYDHSITLQAKGKCVESVVQLAKVPGEAEIVRNGAAITTGADFKGKKLGVTSPGSSTDYLTQYLAYKNGVATSDYSTVKAGAGSTFLAALEHGAIDAGMTTDPTIAKVEKRGLGKVLYDMRTEEGTKQALGGLYPAASVYMQCDFVKNNPKTVQKVVDAFVKGLGWAATHTPEEIAAKMPADYAGDDKALYIKAIGDSIHSFTSDGVMPQGGPETVLAVLGSFNPDVKAKKDGIDLSRTYTRQFAEAAK